MTTSSHNPLYSDEDIIKTRGLDPSRPVKEQMLNQIEKENVEWYMKNGMGESEARAKAKQKRSEASFK